MNLKEAIRICDHQDTKLETYSFRIDVPTLNNLRAYSKINNTTLPKLIRVILQDWCEIHTNDTSNLTDLEVMEFGDKIHHLENDIYTYERIIDQLKKDLNNLKEEINREQLKR